MQLFFIIIKSMLLKNRVLLINTLIIFASAFIISFFIGLYLRNQHITNIEKKYASTINEISASINTNISQNIMLIEGLSQNLSSLGLSNNKNFTHSQLSPFFVETIVQNQEVKDFFIIIEPDIIDINDSLTEYLFDEKGKYIPHWSKNSLGQISLNSFDFEKDEYLYKTTKTNLKTTVFEPYIERRDGQNLLKLSIVAPISYGNKFIGVIGAEISLDWIYTEISTADFDSGDIVVLTDKGNIIAVSNKPYFKGRFLTDYFSEDVNSIFFKLKENRIIREHFINDNFTSNPFDIEKTNISWQVGTYTPKKIIFQKGNIIFLISILSGLGIAFLISLLIYILNSNITKPLEIIEIQSEKILKGELDFSINQKIKSKDLNNIYKNLLKTQDKLNQLVKINYKIANRDYTEYLGDPNNEHDLISKSINHSINEIAKRWEIRIKEEEEKKNDKWTNDGINKIQEARRIGNKTMTEVADNIIETLAKYTNAYIAGLFIYNDKNKNDIHLEAISTYAYQDKRNQNIKIKINEGLIGTVAKERKEVYYENIPSNYKHIISGLGESLPKSIFIVPLMYETTFLGIIELAFLKKLKPLEKDFILRTKDYISQTINTINTNNKSKSLLLKSQEQTKELEKAQKISEENLAKIQESQKKAKIREAEMRGILNAVNNTILTIEYTTEGILLDVNKKYLETMHFDIEELRGVNVLTLVKSEKAELEDIIKRVSKGEFVEKLVKRFTKYGEVKWLFSTYTPFYNIDNKITKILYFAVDITNDKLKSEQLQNEK